MVRVYRPRDDYANSILKVCNTLLEMFSSETMLDPKAFEAVISTTLPSATVIFKSNCSGTLFTPKSTIKRFKFLPVLKRRGRRLENDLRTFEYPLIRKYFVRIWLVLFDDSGSTEELQDMCKSFYASHELRFSLSVCSPQFTIHSQQSVSISSHSSDQ